MKALFEAAALVQQGFEARGWQSCIIGGIANFRWGTPRLTTDVDVTLLTGFGHEEEYARLLLELHASRIDDALAFAVANRVALLRTADGFGLDVAFGAMPFEVRTIDRATPVELQPGAVLRTCSAEDLIVHKAFAARPQDWADVEGVILQQRGALEWSQIWRELTELADLKEEPELVEELRKVVARTERVVGWFPH